MPGQEVSKIENFAFEFLSSYYAKQSKNSGLLVRKLEKTKQGAEVDGLFVMRKEDNSFFAASLSTRQSDQLAAMIIRYKKKGLSNYRFLTAGALLLLTASIGYALDYWPLLYLAPVFVAIAGFILHSQLEKRRLKQQQEKLVSELKQAPANEQWLGISVSSLHFRKNMLADNLLAICQRRHIGLITVGRRAKIVLRQAPTAAGCRRGDFLSYYTSEATLRKLLTDLFMRVA
jgi:hypothetical protein